MTAVYAISEPAAYHLSELIEDHAFETYDGYLKAHEAKLKSMEVPDIARKYYERDNPFLFDQFCTVPEPDQQPDGEGRYPMRRPALETLCGSTELMLWDLQRRPPPPLFPPPLNIPTPAPPSLLNTATMCLSTCAMTSESTGRPCATSCSLTTHRVSKVGWCRAPRPPRLLWSRHRRQHMCRRSHLVTRHTHRCARSRCQTTGAQSLRRDLDEVPRRTPRSTAETSAVRLHGLL